MNKVTGIHIQVGNYSYYVRRFVISTYASHSHRGQSSVEDNSCSQILSND